MQPMSLFRQMIDKKYGTVWCRTLLAVGWQIHLDHKYHFKDMKKTKSSGKIN